MKTHGYTQASPHFAIRLAQHAYDQTVELIEFDRLSDAQSAALVTGGTVLPRFPGRCSSTSLTEGRKFRERE